MCLRLLGGEGFLSLNRAVGPFSCLAFGFRGFLPFFVSPFFSVCWHFGFWAFWLLGFLASWSFGFWLLGLFAYLTFCAAWLFGFVAV